MRRSKVIAIASLAAFGLSAAVSAQEVYQWKDANGVTHYSQTPPPRGQYQQRAITHSGATQPQAASEAPAAQENAQCKAARDNLRALQGSGPVHEAAADGTAGRALTDAERASQTELANAAIRAYCGATPQS